MWIPVQRSHSEDPASPDNARDTKEEIKTPSPVTLSPADQARQDIEERTGSWYWEQEKQRRLEKQGVKGGPKARPRPRPGPKTELPHDSLLGERKPLPAPNGLGPLSRAAVACASVLAFAAILYFATMTKAFCNMASCVYTRFR